MNLEGTKLSEIIHIEKDKYYIIPIIYGTEKITEHTATAQNGVCQRLRGGANGETLVKLYKALVMSKFWGSNI